MLDKSQFDVSLVNFWQDIYQTFKKFDYLQWFQAEILWEG